MKLSHKAKRTLAALSAAAFCVFPSASAQEPCSKWVDGLWEVHKAAAFNINSFRSGKKDQTGSPLVTKNEPTPGFIDRYTNYPLINGNLIDGYSCKVEHNDYDDHPYEVVTTKCVLKNYDAPSPSADRFRSCLKTLGYSKSGQFYKLKETSGSMFEFTYRVYITEKDKRIEFDLSLFQSGIG